MFVINTNATDFNQANYVTTDRYWYWNDYYIWFPWSWLHWTYCNLDVIYDRPIFVDNYYNWAVWACWTRYNADRWTINLAAQCYNAWWQFDQTCIFISNKTFKWGECVWDYMQFSYVISTCSQWWSWICYNTSCTELSYWYIDNTWVLHTIWCCTLWPFWTWSERTAKVLVACSFVIENNGRTAPAWSRLFFKDCSTACLCYCNCYSYYLRNFGSGSNDMNNYFSATSEWSRATPVLVSIQE